MNLLIRHAEYLLGRRDCVVLPGLGALICAVDSARFDRRNPGMLLPPRRRVAFNSSITADDGLLAASLSRGLGITLADAAERVSRGVEALRQAVTRDGSASFGRLGFFRATADGSVVFSAARVSAVNAAFAVLPDVDVDRLKGDGSSRPAVRTVPAPVAATRPDTGNVGASGAAAVGSRWRKLRNGAAGVAASLAVIVTITLFMLHPIRMANEPQKASLAPIPAIAAPADGNTEAPRTERRLTIGLPAERGFVEVTPDEIKARREARANRVSGDPAKQKASGMCSSKTDRFCVVVASFPTMGQARTYIASKGGNLEVLQSDGKCRVYAATAPTYAAANALRENCGVADAWVCRR